MSLFLVYRQEYYIFFRFNYFTALDIFEHYNKRVRLLYSQFQQQSQQNVQENQLMTEIPSNQSLQVSDLDSSATSHPPNKQLPKDCPLCQEPSLQILINNALFHKYLDTQYINYLSYIDNIMNNQICPEAIKHREMAVVDQDEEFMRRMYSISEYDYKNKAIVDYYKFHQDYPKMHLKGVSSIMEKFHDRKKQFQYKKIKRILKEEQDISITTQKSSQIFSDIQEDDKKSHYSNVLNDLTQNSQLFCSETNQSVVWKNLCIKIDKAFQNQTLSPINFKKKSIFNQPEQKDSTQTKNFVNYLKNQQQKKQKQEKYKNFIRSNKESRYNSIEQGQSKQYSSGTNIDSNLRMKKSKGQRPKPYNSFKGSSAFYDGKMFYNPNIKGNSNSNSKDQKTKQQSSTPSQDNLDFDYIYAQNGFRKNKELSNHHGLFSKREQRDALVNKINPDQYNLDKFKNKLNFKTTQEIYRSATQDMKLKKRSISYNSLANTNIISKRSSHVNILALKQKDFQIRNRASSHGGKISKQKTGLINQINSKKNSQNQVRLQRGKYSSNFKTSRSVTKLHQPDLLHQSQNKFIHNSVKKITVPKQVIQSLKGKSFSASKLKTAQIKYSAQPRYVQAQQRNRQIAMSQLQRQVVKEKKRDLNLFIQNGLKSKKQIKEMVFGLESANSINIEKLLKNKLLGKSQTQKLRHHKILI